MIILLLILLIFTIWVNIVVFDRLTTKINTLEKRVDILTYKPYEEHDILANIPIFKKK